MKATGIVRRIDDLGRVVIPKEIRRTLRVREGEPLEIFTDREGQIILKKYSPIGELTGCAKQYAEVLAKISGHTVGISDKDTFVAASGPLRREISDKEISKELEECLEQRRSFFARIKEKPYVPITQLAGENEFSWEFIVPVISDGDVIGSVVLVGTEEKEVEEGDEKLALATAGFLGRQIEA